jgi:hypothetical protein
VTSPIFKSDALTEIEKFLDAGEWTFELFKYNNEWFANFHCIRNAENGMGHVGGHSTISAISAITRLLNQRGEVSGQASR